VPGSLEIVINRFVEKSEEAVVEAQKRAATAIAALTPDSYET
jgi:hypothetical protein